MALSFNELTDEEALIYAQQQDRGLRPLIILNIMEKLRKFSIPADIFPWDEIDPENPLEKVDELIRREISIRPKLAEEQARLLSEQLTEEAAKEIVETGHERAIEEHLKDIGLGPEVIEYLTKKINEANRKNQERLKEELIKIIKQEIQQIKGRIKEPSIATAIPKEVGEVEVPESVRQIAIKKMLGIGEEIDIMALYDIKLNEWKGVVQNAQRASLLLDDRVEIISKQNKVLPKNIIKPSIEIDPLLSIGEPFFYKDHELDKVYVPAATYSKYISLIDLTIPNIRQVISRDLIYPNTWIAFLRKNVALQQFGDGTMPALQTIIANDPEKGDYLPIVYKPIEIVLEPSELDNVENDLSNLGTAYGIEVIFRKWLRLNWRLIPKRISRY